MSLALQGILNQWTTRQAPFSFDKPKNNPPTINIFTHSFFRPSPMSLPFYISQETIFPLHNRRECVWLCLVFTHCKLWARLRLAVLRSIKKKSESVLGRMGRDRGEQGRGRAGWRGGVRCPLRREEAGGGRGWWRKMQEGQGGAEVREEKHAERMKRRKGTKDANRGRDKGKMQTMERGESQREGEREFAGWQMEGGASGEDRCQDKVEEKVKEGQRQDNIILEQAWDSRNWDRKSRERRRKRPLPSVGLMEKQNWLVNIDPKTMFCYRPVHPPVAMDANQPLKPQWRKSRTLKHEGGALNDRVEILSQLLHHAPPVRGSNQ